MSLCRTCLWIGWQSWPSGLVFSSSNCPATANNNNPPLTVKKTTLLYCATFSFIHHFVPFYEKNQQFIIFVPTPPRKQGNSDRLIGYYEILIFLKGRIFVVAVVGLYFWVLQNGVTVLYMVWFLRKCYYIMKHFINVSKWCHITNGKLHYSVLPWLINLYVHCARSTRAFPNGIMNTKL